MFAANTITIDRLALRASRQVSPRMVSSSSRKIESIDPAAIGIPPSAILIIRYLEDPLPRHLNHRRGSAEAIASWPRAVERRMAQIYASAARPRLAVPESDANAVAFA